MKFWEAVKAVQEGKQVMVKKYGLAIRTVPELLDQFNFISDKEIYSDDWELYRKPNTRQVYQWRYYPRVAGWVVCDILMSPAQAKFFWKDEGYKYEIHAGPFEVEED